MADHGIRDAVYGSNLRDINLVLENIIYMEMLRRGYKIHIGKIKDKEVDFICTRQSQKIYIQVAYMLASPETIAREFGIFREIPDNYPKYVISMDEIDMSRDGIIHCNIRDFLLSDNLPCNSFIILLLDLLQHHLHTGINESPAHSTIHQ